MSQIKKGGPVSEAEVEKLYNALKPLPSPEFLFGSWGGGGFDTGHEGYAGLARTRWDGKDFRSVDDVDPIMVLDDKDSRVWSEEWGHASLREMVFRGVTSTAMIYDNKPIFDHFRFVKDDLVMGAMDCPKFMGRKYAQWRFRRIKSSGGSSLDTFAAFTRKKKRLLRRTTFLGPRGIRPFTITVAASIFGPYLVGLSEMEKELVREQPLSHNQEGVGIHDLEKDGETGLAAVDIQRIEKVYRKLDMRIIPAFWTLYFLCSAIRSNVGLAQTMNIEKKHDLASKLNLGPKQVSTGLALFYVCYVVFDLPSNLVMTRISPRVWMSRIVIAVGIIGSCMAAMKAAWSFYLLRLLLGIVIAGMWPGMAYYLTLFYPPSRTGKRIGQYFTAAQVSAAVVGLVSAGFQKMDGLQGLVGFQWMFLLYGLVAICVGIGLLWWLPDRPLPPGETMDRAGLNKWIPQSRPALTGEDALIHYEDLTRVYRRPRWTVGDLWHVVTDWRVWPLFVMYFGVVGVGIGVQNYSTVIIRGTNAKLTGIQLSLLSAPIWIMDLIAILLVTPFSDRFHRHRALFFSVPVCIQIVGLLMTTYASGQWTRYGGLLLVGFGLGPTVPITMTWTNEIFQPRHGEVGVAAASALVSGLGNLGSILTTYALFAGWPTDARKGRKQYRKSTLVMVGILCLSILSAAVMTLLLRYVGNRPNGKQVSSGSSTSEGEGVIMDGAARRELQERGFGRLWWSRR
ncbi:MAG: hypothetical protein Q9170_004476 [Blastenia crenularia]